jgi:GH24 family phage-related lysozyme (muramidase)
MIPDLKRIAKQTVVGLGILSGKITVKNEYFPQEQRATTKAKIKTILANNAEEARKASDEKISTNLNKKMNVQNISNSYNNLEVALTEESELQKRIKERPVD